MCWRRLAAWKEVGVWDRLHLVLPAKLRAAKQLGWSRAVIDSPISPIVKGRGRTATPTPGMPESTGSPPQRLDDRPRRHGR